MSDVLNLLLDRFDTPMGELLLVADEAGNLRAIDWHDYEARMMRLLRLHYGQNGFELTPARNPHGLRDAIADYFGGEIGAIEAIPVQTGGTPFQRSVWKELRRIQSGTAVTYAKLAEQIARPSAVRAVGLANGANPIGIVVPCHRVIGSNGSLTGYGGGLERKRWLLDHEQKHVRNTGTGSFQPGSSGPEASRTNNGGAIDRVVFDRAQGLVDLREREGRDLRL